MLLSNSKDKILCPHFMAPGPRRQQWRYRRQAVLLEAVTVNNSWSNKIKEPKRIRKSQASIALGVANHQQTKLLGLNQVETTIVGTTGRK